MSPGTGKDFCPHSNCLKLGRLWWHPPVKMPQLKLPVYFTQHSWCCHTKPKFLQHPLAECSHWPALYYRAQHCTWHTSSQTRKVRLRSISPLLWPPRNWVGTRRKVTVFLHPMFLSIRRPGGLLVAHRELRIPWNHMEEVSCGLWRGGKRVSMKSSLDTWLFIWAMGDELELAKWEGWRGVLRTEG